MATLEQLRSLFGGDSDEATLQAASKRLGLPVSAIADDIGFDMGGKWGNRARASVDNAQSQLYGVGEALGLGDWARRGREGNAVQADVRSRMAQDQGAITSYKQVGGLRDAAEYVGGLALDTAPQLGAMLAGGAVGGLAGAGAVGYGFALGDVLQNQREQAGKTDLLSAAAYAVPYAAVDTLSGVGGRLARGSLARSGVKALDEMRGLPGAAARTAASVGRTAIAEGAGETFQEVMNQGGRIAVDPNASFFSDEALDRYGESFVGGAALGGAFGAVGGHRRSEGYQPTKIDLLNTAPPPAAPAAPQGLPLQLGYTPAEQQGYVVFPDGSVATNADAELMYRYDMTPDTLGGIRAGGTVVDPTLDPELAAQYTREPGIRFDPTMAEPGARGALPNTMVADQGAQVALDAAGADALSTTDDPGLAEAKRRFLEQRARAERDKEMQAQAAQVAAEIRARDQRAQRYGIKGTRGFELFSELESALQSGVITDQQFAQATGMVAANKAPAVKKFLEGITATKAAIAESDATPVTPVGKPAQPVAAPSTPLAGIDPNKTAEVGRAGRKQSVTPQQLLAKIQAASPLDKLRIMAVTGMEVTQDPTTGKAKLVETGSPLTFDQVAEEESRQTGRKVSKQAVQQALAAYGITEDVVTQMASTSPTQVTAEELGIDPTAPDSSGYRVEDRASKATGSGMVNTAEDGQLTKKQQDQVSAALAQARQSNFEPEALAATAGTLSGAAKTRFLSLAAKEMAAAAPAAPASDAVKVPTGAKAKDLRDDNAAKVEANVRALLGAPEAGNAAADWDESRVNWADLADSVKADWIERYIWNLKKNGGDLNFQELERDQEFVEREHHDYQANKGQQAATGSSQIGDAGAGSRAAGSLEGPGARPVDPAAGDGVAVDSDGAEPQARRADNAPKPVVQAKPTRDALPDSASKEEQAAYKRQATKVAKYETLLACLTR